MRNPKKGKFHLTEAHKAVKAGDGASARHHIGHALAALKDGPARQIMETPAEEAQEVHVSAPVNAPAKLTLAQRLKAMAMK